MPEAIPFETGFGRRLRHERERRKISLSTIAASTKISAALLDGLEREDLSRWPSGIFRRSFVRAYAQAIGLDADAVVAEFLERFPDRDDPSRDHAAVSESSAAPAPPVVAAQPAGALKRPALAVARRSADALRSARNFALQDGPVLRLRMVEALRTFRAGPIISDTKRRWAAAAWDAGVLVAVALVLFIAMNSFWKPFGVLTLAYYVGGIVILGNTPGVCLFASGAEGDDADPFGRVDVGALLRQVREGIRRVVRRNG